MEFTLAFEQDRFGKHSFGYAELEIDGDNALNLNIKLRVGIVVKVAGTLWSRQFRDRQGRRQSETRVIVDKIDIEDLKTK